jgi:hypothetical protein
MSERDVTREQVREEHLRDVDERIQWTYLLAVIGGATALMIAVLWLLEATS